MSTLAQLVAVLLLVGCTAAIPHPSNPKTVTFYNLRPYNLTSNIDEKNSADAMGDIFFYITDRLITPYACRHHAKGDLPFMCMNFQKRLQTKDQVYTELKVEVDSTWGGCPTGFENCSQYADCNPSSGANKTVDWRCDCKHTAPAPKHSFLSTIRSTPRAQKQISASDYWSCNDALETSCGASLWNSKACNTCAGVHKSALSAAKCTPQYLSELCQPNFNECRAALSKTHCADSVKTASDTAKCMSCARGDTFEAQLEAANCTIDILQHECRPSKDCGAVGKLAVPTRYCTSLDNATGLCKSCADQCDGVWDHWKSQVSLLGGEWYSTTTQSDCSRKNSSTDKCAWRTLENKKTVNATCANGNVHKAVEARGEKCFGQCAQPTNSTSDCWILCFVETVLGRDPLNMNKTLAAPMTADELTVPWLKSFTSESPADGGCPALPPAPPSGMHWRQ